MNQYHLTRDQPIAFIMSPRLGDTLIAMIIVNNLKRNGYTVTVFSKHLHSLREWFADFDIRAYPTQADELQQYAVLLHTYPVDVLFPTIADHQKQIILDHHPDYRRNISMVNLQVFFCEHIFKLQDVVRANGSVAPAALHKSHFGRRIIIHPTASDKSRHWLPSRFIQVARELLNRNYEVVFVAAPFEAAAVSWVKENGFTLLITESIDDLATYIYQSACCIGNDSGICHLASSIGIPTITLHQRRKNRIRWHPDWALNYALLPKIPLVFKKWKEKYWKYFIFTRDVLKKFDALKIF